MDIVGLIAAYRYWFLFFGMFFLGETVFLPAAYMSLQGELNPWGLFAVTVFSTIVSDLVWYEIAKRVPHQKLYHWKGIENHQHMFDRLSTLFDKYGLYIIIVSKFVYGTRILVQLIAGIKRIPLHIYLGVNMIGTLAYLLFLYLITVVVKNTLATYVIGGVKFGILAVLVIAVVINLIIHYFARKKWSL